jgi:hypothetical protein
VKLLRLLKRELAAEARSWVDERIVSEEQGAHAYAVVAVAGSGRAILARLDLP